jgi:hypothetical protein
MVGEMNVKRVGQILAVALIGILILSASSCDSNTTADNRDRDATARQYDIYTTSQPIHTYNFSMPRDVMIQIYDATMTAHNTWTVWYALDSRPIDSCPSIGYPIPGGTQLTNPSRTVSDDHGIATVSQGEPNGLFTPPWNRMSSPTRIRWKCGMGRWSIWAGLPR